VVLERTPLGVASLFGRPLSDRDFGQWRKGATVAQPQVKRATKIRSSGQLLIDAGSEA
jgi:hypothetical protein